MSKKMAPHHSSKSTEHYTPDHVVDAVIECLGRIDLDPCSNSYDSPNVPAQHHYTVDEDGLSKDWSGRVFMNPPYGNRIIDNWVLKLKESYELGNVTEALALTPSRSSSQWFHLLNDYPVCLFAGRLKFKGNENDAPFPSAIFYLGKNQPRFVQVFSKLGSIRPPELKPIPVKRSNAEKRQAVTEMLSNGMAEWSDREIARRCEVSHQFVNNIRKELGLSVNIDRYVRRNGTVYQQRAIAT